MDLGPLKAAVDRAKAEADEPPPPGGSKPIFPVEAYLSDDDLTLLWECVRGIRRNHPRAFNLFPENLLASAIVSLLGEAKSAPSLDELAGQLEVHAKEEGPWLVSTPLANIIVPADVIRLHDDALVHVAVLERDRQPWDTTEADAKAEFAAFEALKDRLPRPMRWLQLSTEPASIDTRRGAALLTLETGTAPLAITRARSKAAYALAVWAILHPPGDFEVLPDLGIWVPQPYVRTGQRYKIREEGAWAKRARTQGGAIQVLSEYTAPEPDVLSLPFEALAQLPESRSAQALLSASLALFQASRGSRFLMSERIRYIQVAVETLCEEAPAASYDRDRWQRVKSRHGASDAYVRGYSDADIADLETRLQQARNVATHGADAVLLDLGFPDDLEREMRGGAVAGEKFGLAGLGADLSPLTGAVRNVLASLLRHMRDNDWDDEEFDRQFRA
jgi:hypothetical protein